MNPATPGLAVDIARTKAATKHLGDRVADASTAQAIEIGELGRMKCVSFAHSARICGVVSNLGGFHTEMTWMSVPDFCRLRISRLINVSVTRGKWCSK